MLPRKCLSRQFTPVIFKSYPGIWNNVHVAHHQWEIPERDDSWGGHWGANDVWVSAGFRGKNPVKDWSEYSMKRVAKDVSALTSVSHCTCMALELECVTKFYCH